MSQRYRGIIPPLVSPLSDRDQLDVEGLQRLIEHVLRGGVHGIFILGTTGEGPSLGHHLQRELVSQTCQIVDQRVPVLVGITDPSFFESISLATYAAEAGADAVVLAPPYYFPAGQEELLEYLEELIPGLPLPVLLYNMPAMTKLSYAPQTVRLLAQWPQVAGLKDSSGDLDYFAEVREQTRQIDDFSMLVGPEHLLAETIAMGGDGGVSGGANVRPELYVALYQAASAAQSCEELQRQVESLGRLYRVGSNPASSIVKGIKCALSLMGVCSPQVAAPFRQFAAEDVAKIRELLVEILPPGSELAGSI
ncbi:MAG: dihydrodipicolinate synthase family protein [Pirellulales bacterium]|nr:dihydrodipicolinate synthase family protein [Pirellulales bacterium]